MKRAMLTAILLTLGVNGFGQSMLKPQNEVIMSGEASRAGWGKTGATVTNTQAWLGASPADLVFDGGWWSISNNVTFTTTQRVTIAKGTIFWIGAGVTMAFQSVDFTADSDPVFTGPGTVSGTVSGLSGCWTNWNGMSGTYTLTCSGYDPSDNWAYTDDALGGDLYGTVGNAQIKTGVVTEVEIATDAVGTAEIAAGAVAMADLSSFVSSRVTNPVPTEAGLFECFWAVGVSNTFELFPSDAPGLNAGINIPHDMDSEQSDPTDRWTTDANPAFGQYYVIPTNGIYRFHTYFYFGAQQAWTNAGVIACYEVGIFADKPTNRVTLTGFTASPQAHPDVPVTKPIIAGNATCIDFGADEWTWGEAAYIGMVSDFQYHLLAGDRVYPYIKFKKNDGTNSVTFTGFVDSYWGMWGGLVGTR